MKRLSDDVAVAAFHHTLLLPVLMRGPGGDTGDVDQKIGAFVTAFGAAGWKEAASPGNGVHPDYTYDEVVYFHPFVRDFLFGDGSTRPEKRTLRRFTRRDVTAVAVEVKPEADSDDGRFQVTLRVERAELLLIRPRVAMLLVEVSNRDPAAPLPTPALGCPRTPLTLTAALYLQSRLRRIYPPYFRDAQHGDCPTAVSWRGLPGAAGAAGMTTSSPPAAFDEFTRAGAEPPVYDHWRAFFRRPDGVEVVEPLRTLADRTTPDGLFLQQLLDERMPALSFLAVADPSAIAPDDLDRLPAFDSPNLSYDPEFRDGLRATFRYTRFRQLGTTYYGNGTSFAMLCNTGSFTDKLLGHFRRHYTHLAVIAQFQHAALLYFCYELAGTPKRLAGRTTETEFDDPAWRRSIRVIQHRFLKFRTRSYFTEVSNQVQGKDLFAFWLRHLGTAALFDRVAATNALVYEALENEEARQLSRIAGRGLTVSIGLAVLSAVFAFAGLYSNEDRQGMSLTGTWGLPAWAWLWLVLAGGAAVFGGFVFFCVTLRRWKEFALRVGGWVRMLCRD